MKANKRKRTNGAHFGFRSIDARLFEGVLEFVDFVHGSPMRLLLGVNVVGQLTEVFGQSREFRAHGMILSLQAVHTLGVLLLVDGEKMDALLQLFAFVQTPTSVRFRTVPFEIRRRQRVALLTKVGRQPFQLTGERSHVALAYLVDRSFQLTIFVVHPFHVVQIREKIRVQMTKLFGLQIVRRAELIRTRGHIINESIFEYAEHVCAI